MRSKPLKEVLTYSMLWSIPLIFVHRHRLNSGARASKIPTIYGRREYVETDGLISYGPNFPALYRRAADHVDKILRGVKPGDIPVEQPTKFDLVINLKTAKALGSKFRRRCSPAPTR